MEVGYKIGDCVGVLEGYPEDHFSSCVTDPPYGLAFMGKEWDKVEVYPFTLEWGKAVYRVLKPGAWLLAFGGTRTYHRMICALEDVGFEVRDQLIWMYGSGFPKSYDVSKGIDKHLGAERQRTPYGHKASVAWRIAEGRDDRLMEYQSGPPLTEAAQEWNGWGTALKPAWEPIPVFRKPLDGTVVNNTLKHGCGGINVDECRVAVDANEDFEKNWQRSQSDQQNTFKHLYPRRLEGYTPTGRWPSNVLLDEEAARMLDEQSGQLISGSRSEGVRSGMGYHGGKGDGGPAINGNIGGASRFFYTAKASRSEREKGVRGPRKFLATMNDGIGAREHNESEPTAYVKNHHPTVKPLDLMRYLVRLVTPKKGVCLDPFLGSGTTMLACRLEGLSGLGIEKDEQYEPIIKGRLSYVPPPLESFEDAGQTVAGSVE